MLEIYMAHFLGQREKLTVWCLLTWMPGALCYGGWVGQDDNFVI